MGYMPIHCATAYGHLPLVKYLNEFDADVNMMSKVSILNIFYFMLKFIPFCLER